MRAPEAVPNGAQYLDQVEKVVGLTFFSHATQELAARTDITQLAPEDLQPRTPLYIAGLKLLAAARRDIQLPKDSLPQLTAEQVAEIRKSHQPEIEAIRTGLLGLAEAEPPANYLSFTAMATDLEIGRQMLKRAISQLGIVAVPYRNNQNQANAYYSATDIHDIITHVNSTLPLAHATDVRTAHLRETYRLESHTTFNAILEELGITPVAKRPSTRERWAHFTSAADAKRIEAYVQKMTATPEWMSVADIAEQGGVSPGTVNNYIASQGYTDQIRVLRTPATDDSMPVHTPHLPYSLAEGTIQKFRMIIPDEYMTINEFAACSGLNQKQISKAITRMGLTTHNFTSHSGERRTPFLDGATMYKLRQHLHPYESAPADWVDMQGFKRAVQASDTV
ncbi:MAG TPA: hypothetical protein VLF43_02995, partial [Candidatus Saccharimonadales bacterium]|nr:hypothetical protein [Candidatus Saccharimonadales bacterium]